jgi:hypothetical protein
VDDKPNPDVTPLNELNDPLRQAVGQVRAAPVPAEALARALEKAEKLAALAPVVRRRRLPVRWVAGSFAAAAAAALIAVGLMNQPKEREKQQADAARAAGIGLANKLPAPSAPGDRGEAKAARGEWATQVNGTLRKTENARSTDEFGPPNVTADNMSIGKDGRGPGDLDRSLSRDSTLADMPSSGAAAASPLQAGGGALRRSAPSSGGGSFGGGSFQGQSPDGRLGTPEPPQRTIIGLQPSGTFEPESAEDGRDAAARSDRSLDGKGEAPQLSKIPKDLNRKMTPAAKPGAKASTAKRESRPRIWRDGQPSFARVYVGDGNSLDLVSLDVHVTVEGPRARTIVDHVFRNPHDRQLEGTFEYPLPSGASPSYFAMFLGQTREAIPPRFARRAKDAPPVPAQALADLAPERLVRDVDTTDWGRLQEARVVNKDKALETYEEVVRGRIDPALLEYASGNTFRGRVFPIPPRGYNRVVIAYEETLPVTQDKLVYRFPLPEQKLAAFNFTLQAGADECRDREFRPEGATVQEAAGRVYYTRNWTDEEPKGQNVQFSCTPARPEIQSVTGRLGENGPTYAYARVRPALKQVTADKAAAAHAVFLLDISQSEHAARFGVSMKLLRAILERNPTIQHFNVVTFNAAASWVDPKGWFPNTQQGRDAIYKKLDGVVLEGATDFGAALDRLAEPPAGLPEKAHVDCFVLSDGYATWGETEVGPMVARFESRCPFATRFHCYITGIGSENGELFEALIRRGGGVFSCRGSADLALAAVAHRSQCLHVENVRFVGGPEASDVLVAGRRAAVYPGGELVVAGRFQATGKTTLVVEGTFAGERFVQEYPVEVKDGGELAPRGWAEVAVASLLALNDPKLDSLVTAYCQQFNIGSRVASFLVLENEADYKRFNLEAERGKTVAGDLGKFLDRMWKDLTRTVSPREAFLRFLDRIEGRANVLPGDTRLQVRKLVGLMSEKDFDVPAQPLTGALLHKSDVPPEYLAARDAHRRDVTTYLTETRRRAIAGDVDGAVRVLSSVVEEFPSRGDALRLVGYRLLDLKQPARAAQLFERVQRQRPFEPHSYRDLARALEENGNAALAAVQYEIILGSVWHARFHDSLKLVAQEEYASLMQEAVRNRTVSPAVANYFGERLERMSNPQPKSDLRVTISWNTDATDVDLWVIEPDGTKCFYQNTRTKSGGELSQDQTQGYGPERYQVVKALKGKYRILVHYFNNNPNLLGGETHVNVVVTRFAGTGQEVTTRHTVVLKKKGEEAEVCDVDF